MVLGDRQGAAGLYDLVLEGIDRTGCLSAGLFDGRLFQRAAGMAATAAGRHDEAESHFDLALRQATELPHRPEKAHTQRWCAATLLERNRPGDRNQAEQLLQAGIHDYGDMRMPRHRDLAAALLAS
ncbi:MAG: hypothetical protein ACRDZ7_09985 [Acidimicrobiia bacterium]